MLNYKIIFYLVLISTTAFTVKITIESPLGTPIDVYSNNTLNPKFSLPEHTFSCSNTQLFTFKENYTSTTGNLVYSLNITEIIGNYSVNVEPIETLNLIYPYVVPSQSKVDCQDDCEIEISNNCESSKSYGGVRITVSAIEDLVISYNVICDGEEVISPFQWGLIILVVACVVQIVLTSHFQEAYSFKNRGFYIGWKSILIFFFVTMTGEVLILTNFNETIQFDILNYTTTGISFLFGIFGVYLCFCEFVFWIKIQWMRRSVFIHVFEIRVMDVLGLVVGMGILCGWYMSVRNWIISDMIYTCMFICIIKLVKVGSLKIGVLAYIIIGISNIIFILITYYKNIYFNNIILTIFNNPFFIMCPIINFVPNQECSWFYLGCIVYPAIVLAYLRRFDDSMGSNIYSRVFIVCFIVCSIAYVITSFVVPFTIPYDLITSPICLILLLFFANRRGEKERLWFGRIHDSKNKNRKQEEMDILNYIKEESDAEYDKEWFKIRISQVSDVSMESKKINLLARYSERESSQKKQSLDEDNLDEKKKRKRSFTVHGLSLNDDQKEDIELKDYKPGGI